MCKQANIARSAYYKWLKHKPSKRELRDQKLLKRIKEIAKSNNSLFGSPKMTMVLNNERADGEGKVYRRTVARLMCVNGIYTSKARFNKTYRYKAARPEETAENILHRDFNATKPNEKWCTDITEEKVPGNPAVGHHAHGAGAPGQRGTLLRVRPRRVGRGGASPLGSLLRRPLPGPDRPGGGRRVRRPAAARSDGGAATAAPAGPRPAILQPYRTQALRRR